MTSDGPCTIRFVDVSDAPALFESVCASRAELAPWMPWCHAGYCIEESRQWLERQLREREAGTEYAFAIMDSSGLYCGGCGLNAIDPVCLRANLGYWVRTSHAGQGLATHAVRQLADWAFEHTALNRLEIVVSTSNFASLRVAEKVGAEREGVARARLVLEGQVHDAVVYSIVRSRWTTQRAPSAPLGPRS
jgi:RimJ/RimL family protein N-acetyltransferase